MNEKENSSICGDKGFETNEIHEFMNFSNFQARYSIQIK